MIHVNNRRKDKKMRNKLRMFLTSIFITLLLAACSSTNMNMNRPTVSSSSSVDSIQTYNHCTRPKQEGCVQIDFLVVQHDEKVKNLKTLIDSTPGSKIQGADLAIPIRDEVGSGKVKLYAECAEYYLLFWNVNTSVSTEQMAFYDGSPSSLPLKVSEVEIPHFSDISGKEVFPDLGNPSVAYRVKVCGGKSSFQIPWDYIESKTYALICAISEDSLYPRKKKQQGSWISSEQWKFFRSEHYWGALFPLIMPAG